MAKRKKESALSSSTEIDEAFDALRSLGYTADQAHAAIEAAHDTGKVFAGVADLIDAVYQQNPAITGALPGPHDLPPEAHPFPDTDVRVNATEAGFKASATPDPAPPKPSRDAESLRLIRETEEEVREAEKEWAEAKEVAKVKKANWEGAVRYLQRTIRESKQEYPLFTQPAPDPAPAVPGPADDWRQLPVSELVKHGLAPMLAAKLAENGVSTLGALADWTRDHDGLNDLPGVGPARREEIDAASAAFWEARAFDADDPAALDDGEDTFEPVRPGNPAEDFADAD